MSEKTKSSSTGCPQFDNFDKARLDRLLDPVAAIRAATYEEHNIGTEDDPYPDIFEFTHHPISVYETNQIGNAEKGELETVPETEVYDAIETSESRNYAVVIQGTVGTGKSELCTYLTHRLKEDNRPVLEVRKDDDLMTLLTQRIPEFYERELDKEFPQKTNYERILAALEDPEQASELADMMVVNALTDLRAEYEISCTEEMRGDFTDLIEDNLDVVRTVAEDEDRGSQIITRQLYEQRSFLQIFDNEDEVDDPADTLNTAVWEALLDKFGTQGLRDIFKLVAEEFDRRPVAVFEDFSIASVQAKDLGDFIERDVAGDSWDFVVAGTVNSLSPLRTQTFMSRFRIFQTNKADSNQVEFLTEENVVEFIEPFLTYIKAGDGSVDVINNGEEPVTYERREPAAGSICGDCEGCPGSKHLLFPFNETFINRIYNPGLTEDERSPRELIKVIKEILEVTFFGPTEVPSSADILDNLRNNITLHDEVYEEAPKFVDLAKWYGEEGNEYVTVERRFGDRFELTHGKSTGSDIGNAGIKLTEDEIRVPLADTNVDISETEEKEDETETEGSSKKDEDEPDQTDDRTLAERRYSELQSQIDNWRSNPKEEQFETLNSLIANAFADQVELLTNGGQVWQDSDLKYNLSKSKQYPFEYASESDGTSKDQVGLEVKTFRRSTLRDVLKYGLELEHGEINRKPFLEDHGTQLTALADRWQTQIQEEFIYDEGILYDKRTDEYDFLDFVIAAYSFAVLLDDPWAEITPEVLNRRFQDNDELTLDENLRQGLENGNMNSSQVVLLDDFVNYAPQFEDLLESRVAISSNRLDLVEIRSRIDETSAHDVLDSLAKSRIENISTRVRYSSDKKLRDMAMKAYKTHQHLVDLETNTGHSDLPETLSERISNVDMDEVKGLIQDLQRSHDDLMQSEFSEQLDRLSKYEQSDLDDLEEGVGIATKQEFETQARIHSTLATSKIQASELVTLINELYKTNPTKGESFAPRFDEVSNYYVN